MPRERIKPVPRACRAGGNQYRITRKAGTKTMPMPTPMSTRPAVAAVTEPERANRSDPAAPMRRNEAVRKDARRDLHEPVRVKIGGAHDRHEPAADGEFAHDVHGEGARGCPKETDERIADGQNGKNKPCMSGHGFG